MSAISILYQDYLQTRKVCTDTRKIEKGAIFFALKGPHFDANTFAEKALAQGAAKAVIDNPAYAKDERYVLVDDVLATLQGLARHHREQLTIPVIGLTGSNGKTTTKELIQAILSKKYTVLATVGNLNNHIGVPLTLLAIRPEHEIAVIEMGANHIGEIAALCTIAQPTHGLITNIGQAHLEGFGSYEGVIRAKSELYDYLIKNDRTVWINSQNDVLRNMAKRFRRPFFYPAKGDDYTCTLTSISPFLTMKTATGQVINTHLVGKYNFENIAAALCIGQHFDVPGEEAAKAVADYTPDNNRSQVIRKGNNTIILDAYNANPSSMTAAIENLAQMDAEKKIVIVGDMKELGEESDKAHEELGTLIARNNFSATYLCGPLIRPATKALPDAHYFENKEDLLKAIRADHINDLTATILVKASRSIGLEAVLEVL